MILSILRMALHVHLRTARSAAVVAMLAAGLLLLVAPGPMRVVAAFVAGAVYGWGITHLLNSHQRRMDMRLVREAVDIVPPGCEGMCKARAVWSLEQRTEHVEFHA